MKTTYFTIADGPVFGYMGHILAQRLYISEGIRLTILKDEVAKVYGVLNRQYWLKAYLWDFVPDNVERIVYFDADILPIAPLPEWFTKCEAPFSARKDINNTAMSQEGYYRPLFENIKYYFNNGIFIATRDAIPMFQALQKQVNNPIHASCVEQTWMNKYVNEMLELNILPRSIGYLVDGEDEPDNVITRHYAGVKNKLERYLKDMEIYGKFQR